MFVRLNRFYIKTTRLHPALFIVFLSCILPVSTWASEPFRPFSTNMYGVSGLIEMPNARMMDDGELNLTTGLTETHQRYTLTFQLLPWMQSSFRYSKAKDMAAGRTHLYDRSFDFRFRLLEEAEYTPSFVLGFQDMIGTGIFSSEYVAASKRIDDFDFTAGMGWGRLGEIGHTENPLGYLAEGFKNRGNDFGRGGKVSFNKFFRGKEIGFFGGVVYTPMYLGDEVDFKVEYSSDPYAKETRNNVFIPSSQVNFGIDYRPTDTLNLGAYWLYGEAFGFKATLHDNPKTASGMPKLDLPPADKKIRPRPEKKKDEVLPKFLASADSEKERSTLAVEASNTDPSKSLGGECSFSVHGCDTAWFEDKKLVEEYRKAVIKSLKAEEIIPKAIVIEPNQVILHFETGGYRKIGQALGRISGVFMNVLPESVETFVFKPERADVSTTQITLYRSQIERTLANKGTAREFYQQDFLKGNPTNSLPKGKNEVIDSYPNVDWGIEPAVRWSFFDPNDPLRYEVGVSASGAVNLDRGLSVSGSLYKGLFGTLSESSRTSDSKLPHVRSDFGRYSAETDVGIETLTANYLFKFSPDVYGKLEAGYLESMFAGAGGEILYRPEGQNWAAGVSMHHVWQREFNMLLDLQNYDVTTGHFSFYWDTPWYGLKTGTHIGRYLAKDYGSTFEISRSFDNGWEVGAFATLTNVPFEKFGEGSFDKGIYVRIPTEWFMPYRHAGASRITIRSLTRDGGQRLSTPNQLYNITQPTGYSSIVRHWDSFWE